MKGRSKKNEIAAHRGFSLIEMMMVISILALISSIILASLVSARDRANVAKAKAEMRQLIQVMVVAQGEQDSTLIKITRGSDSHLAPRSDEDCPSGVDLTDVSACRKGWKDAIIPIGNGSGGIYNGEQLFQQFGRDPWGSPYMLHENQGYEGQGDTCFTFDEFRSAGRNRQWDNNTDDDIVTYIPLHSKCP